jgi:hypothetical protein
MSRRKNDTFSGVFMLEQKDLRVTIEGTETISYFRCGKDGRVLLWVENGKITIQNCNHYRWFILDNFESLPYIDKGVIADDRPPHLDDFDNALREEHIAAVAIGKKRLYLVEYLS